LLFVDRGEVWVLDRRTRERRLAVTSPPDERVGGYVPVSRDNRSLYLTRTLVQDDIWRVSLGERQ